MSSKNDTRTESRSETGAILFIVAACLVVLLGFMGLAIDLGHAYNNKSQLQNMADACALAGAAALDGTVTGIQTAVTRARDTLARLDNRTEFNKTTVAIPESAISFSATLNGTYQDKTWAQGTPATVAFVRVVIPVQPTQMFFAKVIPGIPNVLNFGAEAVAGQKKQEAPCNGIDPFSPSRLDIPYPPDGSPADPSGNFGFLIGTFYSLRNKKDNCNDTDACVGFPNQTGNFALADPNGCGTNTPCFEDTVLNGSQGKCIPLGNGLPTITGDKGINVEKALQERFQQDGDQRLTITYQEYKDNKPNNNNYGRRVLRVPFNDGNIPNGQGFYNVVGHGCFFMAKIPDSSPPSCWICLQFVGSCDLEGDEVPTGGTGPSITQLVLFR